MQAVSDHRRWHSVPDLTSGQSFEGRTPDTRGQQRAVSLSNVTFGSDTSSFQSRIYSPTRRGRIAPDISTSFTPWLRDKREIVAVVSTPLGGEQRLTSQQLNAWARFTHTRGGFQWVDRDHSPIMADEAGEELGTPRGPSPAREEQGTPRGPSPSPHPSQTGSPTPRDPDSKQMAECLTVLADLQMATLKQQENMERLRLKELELKERKLQLYMETQEQARQEAQEKKKAESSLASLDRKCLPVLQPDEDILSFLENFESCVMELQVGKETWLPLLRTQVSGPLLKLLGECKSKTWNGFKTLVLQRFAYTPESIRVKLRELKWDQQQSICCLLSDIKSLIRRWLDVAEAKSKEDIIDLLAREQLGWCIPNNLRFDVLAREPENALQFALSADELLSFKKYFFPKTSTMPTKFNQDQPKPSVPRQNRNEKQPPGDAPPRKPRPTLSLNDVVCFSCQQKGHYSFQCEQRSKRPGPTPTKAPTRTPRKSTGPAPAQGAKMKGINLNLDHEEGEGLDLSSEEEESSDDVRGATADIQSFFPKKKDSRHNINTKPTSAKTFYMHGAASVRATPEAHEDFEICDPRDFITRQQETWVRETFTHSVVVRCADKEITIPSTLDTGADLCSISSEFVDPGCIIPRKRFMVQPYNPNEKATCLAQMAKLEVKYKQFEGEICCLVHDHLATPIKFIIGANLIYVNHLAELQKIQTDVVSKMRPVQTRAQTKRQGRVDHEQEPHACPNLPNVTEMHHDGEEGGDTGYSEVDDGMDAMSEDGSVIGPFEIFDSEEVNGEDADTADLDFSWIKPNEEFRQEQMKCPTLAEARRLATLDLPLGPDRQNRFCWKGPEGQKLLYREKLQGSHNIAVAPQVQLLVPKRYRNEVLQMAHDFIGGHVGTRKTHVRITNHLFWPNLTKEVKEYCSSCVICQRIGHRNDKTKACMEEFPLTGTPFSTMEMDVFGPLLESSTGKKYLICFTCPVSKWVEAIATSSVTAKQVAKAFLEVASRVGWPDVLVSDQAKSFTGELMNVICEMTGTRQRFSVAFHPESHGAVERVQQTLYRMILAFIQENKKTWSDALPYILYAYRTSPHESLGGFTPSDVVLGRNLRGPLELVRAEWEGSLPDTSIPVARYIRELQRRLQNIRDITAEHLQEAQKKYKAYHDMKAKPRSFQIGDKVWVLDPIRRNKLQVHWLGPGVIEQKWGNVNYVVRMSRHEKKPRVYHANRLKPYVERETHVLKVKLTAPESLGHTNPDLLQEFKEAGDLSEIYLEPEIPVYQQRKLYKILKGKASIFTNTPGGTTVVKHKISVTDDTPIKSAPYRAIGDHAVQIEEEIQEMLDLGIIQPSQSPWGSPVVIVPKKSPDGQIQRKVRFCVDYRKLNRVTISDPYPMPRAEDLIEKIARGAYLSCLDLSSGYWQIGLDPESREKSAFVTHTGTYEFSRMPFGLCNAGATFQRLMDIVLHGLPFAHAYIDDIVIFSNSFEEHLEHVNIVLQRLQDAGLTVKASKCQWLKGKVVYLGHWVGSGSIEPLQAKVESIKNWPIPKTKKQVQSFLGLVNYYRKFVPHFSQLAAPIINLTGKRMPVKVVWSDECQHAFETLKNCLMQYPILIPPDFDKPFLVQTDASESGVGCVLLQEREGTPHPVAFFSKKLLPRERNYSVPEKECLGIVWALTKLRPYLWGRKFILQTDHQALKFLSRMKDKNQRLLRWSLTLQDFEFDVQYIPGSQNVLADSLSRMYFGVENSPKEEYVVGIE